MRINFFRPISSLTHAIDHALVGNQPVWNHFVNIAWYLVVIYLFHRLMSRFLPRASRTLFLATVIFALDDTHSLNIVWLANRNECVSGTFVMLGLLAWLRLGEAEEAGRSGSKHAVLIVLAFVCALLSKESALVLPVFVLAHAVLFPRGQSRSTGRGEDGEPGGSIRWAALRRHAWLHATLFAIGVAFIVLYLGAGRGANSAYYINPFRNPALWAHQFFRSGAFHTVILATGVPLHILSRDPVRDYPWVAALVAAITVSFWLLAWRWLRRERAFWYFVVCMVASQAMLTTSFPDPRILFLPSIGFSWIVARLMQEAWARRASWKKGRAIVVALVGLHLVLAPVLDQVCIAVVNGFQVRYHTLTESLRTVVDYEHLGPDETDVFFINWQQREVSTLFALYLRRALPTGVPDPLSCTHDEKKSYPDRLRLCLGAERIHYFPLSFMPGDVEARAIDDHQLVLSARGGQHFFSTMFELLYTTGETYRVGQQFDTGVFRATIEEVGADNRVLRVRYTFPEPLWSPRYRFMRDDGTRFVAVSFGPPGRLP
jgi:hypothetical protein